MYADKFVKRLDDDVTGMGLQQGCHCDSFDVPCNTWASTWVARNCKCATRGERGGDSEQNKVCNCGDVPVGVGGATVCASSAKLSVLWTRGMRHVRLARVSPRTRPKQAVQCTGGTVAAATSMAVRWAKGVRVLRRRPLQVSTR